MKDSYSCKNGMKCAVSRVPKATIAPYSVTFFNTVRCLSNGASSIPNIHIPYNQIITFDAIAAVAEKDAAKYIAVTIKSPIIRFGNIESNDLSFETYYPNRIPIMATAAMLPPTNGTFSIQRKNKTL